MDVEGRPQAKNQISRTVVPVRRPPAAGKPSLALRLLLFVLAPHSVERALPPNHIATCDCAARSETRACRSENESDLAGVAEGSDCVLEALQSHFPVFAICFCCFGKHPFPYHCSSCGAVLVPPRSTPVGSVCFYTHRRNLLVRVTSHLHPLDPSEENWMRANAAALAGLHSFVLFAPCPTPKWC